ncbi:hypothetical protein L6164_029597 [Bauhinia variegata]|uniref:Uncharacterized protein n=1 Tax=Bauhinia variegata TaxID=167791 RepID=A0ACB9L985_BAUVA|nr:hypothetical protein L6164_029597 [Bauhinia variegata]
MLAFQLNLEALPDYEESLTKFGQGLGPVVQNVIKKKLETVRLYKLLSGQTASQNQASSSSAQGIIQQQPTTPQATAATPTQHQASYSDLLLPRTQQLAPPQTKPTDKQNQASSSNLLLPHIQLLTPQATKTQRQTSYIDLLLSPQEKPTDQQHQTSYSDLLFSPTQQLAPRAKPTDKEHQTSYSDLLSSPSQQLTPQAKTTDKQHQTSYSDLLPSPNQQLTPRAKTTDKQRQASYIDLLLAPSQQLNPPQATTQQNKASYNEIMLPHTQLHAPQTGPEPSYSDLLLAHAFPLSNRPLSIPGAAAASQNKNFSANTEQSTSVRDKGKAICVDQDNYNATAAALLGSIFLNYDKGKSSSTYQGEASSSINIRRPLRYDLNSDVNTSNPSMEAPIQVYGQDRTLQQNRNLLQLSAYNNNASSGQCSNPLGMSDALQSNLLGRPSRVRSLVWPTRVISRPQPNQSQSNYGQSLLSQPFLPNNSQADCSYGNNYSAPSLLSLSDTNSRRQAVLPPMAADQTSWLSSSTGLISDTNSRRQAVLPPMAVDQTSWLSSSTGLISDTNSRRQAILPPKAVDQTSWLSSLSENFQQLLASSYNSSSLSELNTHGYAGTDHATPSYGHGGMDLNGFTGYVRRASLQGRTQEGSTSRLPWNEKDHPELALQL